MALDALVSVWTDSWFPICEDCDVDAVALVEVDGVWVFHCDRHRGWSDVTFRRVWDGWQPVKVTAAWRAAVRAMMGVRQPLWERWAEPDAWVAAVEEGWEVREHEGERFAVPPWVGA